MWWCLLCNSGFWFEFYDSNLYLIDFLFCCPPEDMNRITVSSCSIQCMGEVVW